MRIEYKDPEHKENEETERPVYESDLTKQQKRQMEREKIRKMSGTKKLGYLFTYYKVWLLVPVILIVLVVTGLQIRRNALEQPLLYVNISDPVMGADEQAETLSADLLQRIGTGNRYETVPVTTSVLSSSDYEASMMMSVWLSTGEMDLVICDEETCKTFTEQGVFFSCEEIFGGDSDRVKDHMKNGMLTLDPAVWFSYGLTAYTPVYVGVPTSSAHVENAKKALLYLLGLE